MPSHRKAHRKPAHAEAARPADPFRGWLLAGMTALLVARPLFPSESAATQGDGLPLVMLWLALLVIWAVAAIGRRRFVLRFGPVDGAVLLLVVWQCIAALHAVRYGSPRPALNMLWESVGLGLVFFLARQLIDDAREARAVVAAMIALAAAISVYGLYQCAIEQPAMQKRFAEDPEAMLRENELNYPPGTPIRDAFERRLANRQPLATFALTNSLAAVLAPWLVVGLGIVVLARRDRRKWIASLVCLVPSAVCLLFTKSRSGYAAAAVGIIWIIWRALAHWRFRRWLAVVAVLAGLLTFAAMAALARPTLAKAANSLGYRLQYWQATLHLIADRPWLGCGPGNFQDVYTQYKLPEASEEVADPHNFLLEVWATAGTPAMLALLGILGLFWHYCRVGFSPRSFNQEPTATECAVAVGSRLNKGGLKSTLPTNDWQFVLAGLVGGFLLSIPLGQISAAPPNSMAILIGLPVAAVCLALLIPWVRNGAFPPDDHDHDHAYMVPDMVPAGMGAAVLLVDLLTTGGIGIPAVAQSLWLLLALGFDGAWPREVRRGVAIGLLAIGLGLSLACHQTSYARVLPCQGFQRLARHESIESHQQSALAREYLDDARQSALEAARRHGQLALEAAQRAVDADPRSSDAHALLADLHLESWLKNLDPADYEAFETQDALARRMAPQAAPIWRASADRYQRAFAKTDARGQHPQPRAIEHAIESAQRTVELYPNSGSDHAALAMIYRLSGDQASCRREARIALELDRRMPHEETKLSDALRRRLEAAAEGQ